MITELTHKKNQLYLEKVLLKDIAEKYGTPCYVYSKSYICKTVKEYMSSLTKQDLMCFAVKANSNLSILRIIAELGGGFDVVSGGELERVILAGGNPKKVVFSGVGKSDDEIYYALKTQIKSINIESKSELQRVINIAQRNNLSQEIALRINPETTLETHPYLETGALYNKFGISFDELDSCLEIIKKQKHIILKGIAFHIGSGIKNFTEFQIALTKAIETYNGVNKNFGLSFLDVGGGLSPYTDEETINSFISKIKKELPSNINIIVEPGKSIIAKAGVLLTKALYLKKLENNIIVVDAGMNDMIRVPLYQGKHPIINLSLRPKSKTPSMVVGPICESADIFTKDYMYDVHEHDILAITDVGAYGFSMSSNYNSRPRACEVLVQDDLAKLIRQRENNKENLALEIFDDN